MRKLAIGLIISFISCTLYSQTYSGGAGDGYAAEFIKVEQADNHAETVFPNPVKRGTAFFYAAQDADSLLIVYNKLGETVLSEKLCSGELKGFSANFMTGVYIVEVREIKAVSRFQKLIVL